MASAQRFGILGRGDAIGRLKKSGEVVDGGIA